MDQIKRPPIPWRPLETLLHISVLHKGKVFKCRSLAGCAVVGCIATRRGACLSLEGEAMDTERPFWTSGPGVRVDINALRMLCFEWVRKLCKKTPDNCDLEVNRGDVFGASDPAFHLIHMAKPVPRTDGTMEFEAGFEIALRVATAVLADPFGDPRPEIEPILRDYATRMHEGWFFKDNLARRLAEVESRFRSSEIPLAQLAAEDEQQRVEQLKAFENERAANG